MSSGPSSRFFGMYPGSPNAFSKEYTLNHTRNPSCIQGIFLNGGVVLGFVGSPPTLPRVREVPVQSIQLVVASIGSPLLPALLWLPGFGGLWWRC